MDGGPTRSRITSWEDALGRHVEALFAVFPGGLDQAVVTALAYELAQDHASPRLRTSSAERPDLWAAAIATAIEGLFPAEDVAAVTEFLAGGLAWEFDPPRPITPNQARTAAWVNAVSGQIEDLVALMSQTFGNAATAVLAGELARAYEAPKRRTRAKQPDDWAGALSNAVAVLLPDEFEAAAVIEILAFRMALAFEPPHQIGSRQGAGNRYTDREEHANENNYEGMAQITLTLSLREGARIAAWYRSLAFDVHQLMPKDPLAAEALTAAMAVRMSVRYKSPRRRQPIPVESNPSAGDGRHHEQ